MLALSDDQLRQRSAARFSSGSPPETEAARPRFTAGEFGEAALALKGLIREPAA
jgi:hypothetical protein